MIDMEYYARKAHFDYFRTMQYPYIGTTVEVDVTELLEYCHAQKRSFYITFIHVAALAANGVPELRQRIRGDGIVEYSECPTSHVEMLEDTTYYYCTLHHDMDLCMYYDEAEKSRQRYRTNGITEEEDVESMLFVSTLPWVHYSSLIQPVAGGDESNPRITWGRYEKSADGRVRMPVSLLAHHSLVDGLHIGRFYENLEREIGRFQKN